MTGSGKPIADLGLLAVTLLCAYVGQSVIKFGLLQAGQCVFDSVQSVLHFYVGCLRNAYVLLGACVVCLGFLLWVAFLSRMELSQALPMLALSYVPWLIIGHLVFGEPVTPMRVIGVVFIMVGVGCVASGGPK